MTRITRASGTGLFSVRYPPRLMSRDADAVVCKAIEDGRIAESERERYFEMYTRNPMSTKVLLSKLTPVKTLKRLDAEKQRTGKRARTRGTGLFSEN